MVSQTKSCVHFEDLPVYNLYIIHTREFTPCSYQTMFSECRIKVLGIVFQCSDTHFLNVTRISNIYLFCVSASFCTGCVVLRQFLSFLFLAQVQKVSNEMTLVANESNNNALCTFTGC